MCVLQGLTYLHPQLGKGDTGQALRQPGERTKKILKKILQKGGVTLVWTRTPLSYSATVCLWASHLTLGYSASLLTKTANAPSSQHHCQDKK